MRTNLFLLIIFLGPILAIFMPSRSEAAACAGCCNCVTVRNFIVSEINKHEDFLVNKFWKDFFEPALSVMANQINSGLTQQTAQLGSFLEGQNNIEKRRVLQELSADTAKNYLPSEQLCRFASLGLSLSSSEENARANRLLMMERSQNRQLGEPNTVSASGDTADKTGRAVKRASRTCDPAANGGRSAATCVNEGDESINADIDFTKTFDSKPTLDVNFVETKTAPTADEQDITMLADNLFGSDLFQRPEVGSLKPSSAVNDARIAVMDMRAIIAKRSVAENSFNALVSMKSRGSGINGNSPTGSTSFIAGILKELDIKDKEALAYLGKAPSYDAQMEVLTKKVYQSPSFYVNLMDNPANIERQYAAMQSFGLMQQRDIFDSILRSEMILSLIVELEVAKYQDEVQGSMDRVKP